MAIFKETKTIVDIAVMYDKWMRPAVGGHNTLSADMIAALEHIDYDRYTEDTVNNQIIYIKTELLDENVDDNGEPLKEVKE